MSGQPRPDARERSWGVPAENDDALDFQPLEFAAEEPRRAGGRPSRWAAIALVVLLIAIVAALVLGAMSLLSDDEGNDASGANTEAVVSAANLVAEGVETPRIAAGTDRAIPGDSIPEEPIPVGAMAVAPAQSMSRLRAAASELVATPDTTTMPLTGDGTGGVGIDPDATIPVIDPQQRPGGDD